jgi:hypothetical protein
MPGSLRALVGQLVQEAFKNFRCVVGGGKSVARQHILRIVFARIVCEPDPVLIVLPDQRHAATTATPRAKEIGHDL